LLFILFVFKYSFSYRDKSFWPYGPPRVANVSQKICAINVIALSD